MNKQHQNKDTQQTKSPSPQKANREIKPGDKAANQAISQMGNDVSAVAMLKQLPPAQQQAVISKWGNQHTQRMIAAYNHSQRNPTVVQAKSNENEVDKYKPKIADTPPDVTWVDRERIQPPNPGSEKSHTPINNAPGKWDLDSIPPGEKNLKGFLRETYKGLKTLASDLPPLKLNAQNQLEDQAKQEWISKICSLYKAQNRLTEVYQFFYCRYPNDSIPDPILSLQEEQRTIQAKQDLTFSQQDSATWKELLKAPELSQISLDLNKRRNSYQLETKLKENRVFLHKKSAMVNEALANRVKYIRGAQLTFEGKPISLEEIKAKFKHDADPTIREKAFKGYEAYWKKGAEVCAQALNRSIEYRLAFYDLLGWGSGLKDHLIDNNLSEETLNAMWTAVANKNGKLLEYLKAKAKLLGKKEGEKLNWYDLYAALDRTNKTFTFTDAANFAVESIGRFDSTMANYCQEVINRAWVDTSRGEFGKCIPFPISGQARISMTFDGSFDAVMILAHELGHAYHNRVIHDQKAPDLPKNLMETIATFNETLVYDAASETATNDQERLTLLATRLDRAAYLLIEAYANFLFEDALLKQRAEAKGPLSVDKLSELAVSSQEKAFDSSLTEYHPLEWAWNPNYYGVSTTFRSFPPVFAYLFSNTLYTQAIQQKDAFFKQYFILLMCHAGSMSVEDLASTHLGVDLTKPEFWENAMNPIWADVDTFVALAEKELATKLSK